MQERAIEDIVECNEQTASYGLSLNKNQALHLVKTREFALKENGRVEFESVVINKLINEFCSSAYISNSNYEQVMHQLIETFYFFKNETLDFVSDDELIEFMYKAYEGSCQGSIELLAGRELEEFAQRLRANAYHCELEPEDVPLENDMEETDEY